VQTISVLHVWETSGSCRAVLARWTDVSAKGFHLLNKKMAKQRGASSLGGDDVGLSRHVTRTASDDLKKGGIKIAQEDWTGVWGDMAAWAGRCRCRTCRLHLNVLKTARIDGCTVGEGLTTRLLPPTSSFVLKRTCSRIAENSPPSPLLGLFICLSTKKS
jgi:hypothetical protein